MWTPGDLGRSYFNLTYRVGARVHSDSWGSDLTAYDSMAAALDRFTWNNPDFLSIFAAGRYFVLGSTEIAVYLVLGVLGGPPLRPQPMKLHQPNRPKTAALLSIVDTRMTYPTNPTNPTNHNRNRQLRHRQRRHHHRHLASRGQELHRGGRDPLHGTFLLAWSGLV